MDKNSYYISDHIDVSRFKQNEFNLIVSSCGTGKTYFCSHAIFDMIPDLKPSEVVFVTSRSLTVEQQVQNNSMLTKFQKDYQYDEDVERGMLCMNMADFARVTCGRRHYGRDFFRNAKYLIIDECHSLFTETQMTYLAEIRAAVYMAINYWDLTVVGLTATPNALTDGNYDWGVVINRVCEPVYRYKAKNLTIMDNKSVIEWVNEHQSLGKTIIMCRTASQCSFLKNNLDGCEMLVSRSNEGNYVERVMEPIRQYITENSKLPDNVDILATTTTCREGINLVEDSNVKNVVCLFTDDMNITQFCGRCRFDIENLAVASDGSRILMDQYTEKMRERITEEDNMFNMFLYGDDSGEAWFDTIKHNVACSLNEIEIFEAKNPVDKLKADTPLVRKKKAEKAEMKRAERAFVDHVAKNIAVCEQNGRPKKYYGWDGKQAICREAAALGVFGRGVMPSFNKIKQLLIDSGFEVYSGHTSFQGKVTRYITIKRREGGETVDTDESNKS